MPKVRLYDTFLGGLHHVDAKSVMLSDCQDVSVHDARFKQSDICKIVHGDEIFDVLPFMHKYE
jgi:hypothetical protein